MAQLARLAILKIAGGQPTPWCGNRYASVKRKGNPAVGFIFRMDGNDADLYALGPENKTQTIDTTAEHSNMTLLLRTLIYKSAMQ